MKSLFIKILVVTLCVLLFSSRVQAVVYYLISTGAGNAQIAANWNTLPDGSGTAASSFNTSGDEFIVPQNIYGVVSDNWTINQSANSSIRLIIHGSLSISTTKTITLYKQNSGYTEMLVYGSLIFQDSATNQLQGHTQGNARKDQIRFNLLPGSFTKTINTSGIIGTSTTVSINTTNLTIDVAESANFEFNANSNQSLSGLPTIVNDLILSGSGTKTLASAVTVNGYLSLREAALYSNGGYTLSFGPASTLEYKNTGNRTTGAEFPATFGGTGGVVINPGSGYTVSLSGNKTALKNIYIQSGTFDLQSSTLNRATSGGTLSISAGASLRIGGTNSISANYSVPILDCTSNIEYYGSDQTVRGINYGNLLLSGSGTKTLQLGTTSICNNFNITGTARAIAATNLSIGGNVFIDTGAELEAGSHTLNVAGSFQSLGLFDYGLSTVNFNGGSPVEIYSGSFYNLIFSGYGAKIAVGSLNIKGDLTINSNFNAGNFSHSVEGDFINNSSFDAAGSTIELKGTEMQTIGGISSTTFNNLSLNNNQDFVLATSSVVSGTLNLTSGQLSLGNNNLTVSAISGGSTSSYIKTNGLGVLKRSIIGGGSEVMFPVGNSGFNPISIANTTSADNDSYFVRVVDEIPSLANDDTKTRYRKWHITEFVPGGSALTVRLTYDPSSLAGENFDPATSPVIGYFTGSKWWAAMPATVSGNTFSSAIGAFVSGDMTGDDDYFCLGSGDAFSASKLAIIALSPASPFANQANVSIVVETQNSQNIPVNLGLLTSYSLTAINTSFSGSPTGSIPADVSRDTLSNLAFTTASATASVQADRTAGENLSSASSNTFEVIGGTLYKPHANLCNWSDAIWLSSSDGGASWTSVPIQKTNFSATDAIVIPVGHKLTANTTASFYNLRIESGAELDLVSSGDLSLNHTGNEDGFIVHGSFRNSGGTFTNTNNLYPVLVKGGTYIHDKAGDVIPQISWSSHESSLSTCRIEGIPAQGFNQSFQQLEFAHTGSLSIDGDVIITNSLSLTNGIVQTGSYKVVLGSQVVALSSNNARIHGNIRAYVPNATEPVLLFPLGDANVYSPLTISFEGTTSGSGYLDVNTLAQAPPVASGLSQSKYINRQWVIAASGVEGFTSCSATFGYGDEDKTGNPDYTALVVRRLNTATNTWSVTNTASLQVNSTQCSDVTEFGSFAIGENDCSEDKAFWLGSISSDWHTGGNWCSGSIPDASKNVYIPAGTINQPIISTTANAATCKDITIETGASLGLNASNIIQVKGDWILQGDFIPNEGSVILNGSNPQEIYGETAFYNLTINNPAGVAAKNNLTVSSILDLQSNNPSISKGTLDMGEYVLTMSSSAFTSGTGDVSGFIYRDNFILDREYSFGHKYTRFFFEDISGQDLPATMMVKVALGAAPDWSSYAGDGMVNAVRRLYEITVTGSSSFIPSIKVHYKDNEYVAGLNESNLYLWTLNNAVVDELGKDAIDVTNNYLLIENKDYGSVSTFYLTVAPKQAELLTWSGGSRNDKTNWNNPANWTPNSTPSAEYRVLIPPTSSDPVLPPGASCVSLEIASGGVLNSATNASLTLYGNWINLAGVAGFNSGNSLITFNANASIQGNTDFYSIVVTDGAQITPALSANIGISGALSLSFSGMLNADQQANTITFKGTDQYLPNTAGSLLEFWNLIVSGTGTKYFPAAMSIAGNLTNNGTINTGTYKTTLTFNGTTVQTIGGTASTAFNHLKINNGSGGSVSLSIAVSADSLSLTSGVVSTTTTNVLSITGSTSGVISGGSAASYVNGPLKRTLPESLSTGSSYHFPLGKGGAYLPFELVNPTTGTGLVTAQAEAFAAGSGGAADNLTLESISQNEYWSLSTAGNFTNSAVSLSRPTAISPLNAIGGCTSQGGVYSNLNGTVQTNSVLNSDQIGSYRYFVLAKKFTKITWDGSSSNSWFTAANWTPPVVPGVTSEIIIPNVATLPVIAGSSPANDLSLAGSLNIQDNASLSLQAGPVLSLQPGIVVNTNSSGKIILESGARYLNLSNSAPRLEVQRQLSGGKGWRMLSSPVPATFAQLTPSPLVTQGYTGSTFPALQPNLLWWDESDGGTTLQGWRQPSNSSDNLVTGRGYFYYVFDGAGRLNLDGTSSGQNYTDILPQTLSVTGTEAFNGSGSFSYSLNFTARDISSQNPLLDTIFYDITSLDQGWNLVGNPTASTLDWDASWTKVAVSNAIYIWDPSANSGNGDYLSWNGSTGSLGSGKIAPFQAFWVHTSSSPQLSFSNTAKSSTAGSFLRSVSAGENKLSVALKLQVQDLHTTSYLSFGDPAAVGIDYWDAFRLEPMSETWLELFSLSPENQNIPLVINNLPLPKGEQGMNIPLYIDGQLQGQGLNGSYTLSWEIPSNWPSDWELSLQDHSRQQAVSMHEQSSYSFEHNSSTTRATNNSLQPVYKASQPAARISARSLTRSSTDLPPYSIRLSKAGKDLVYVAPQAKLLLTYPNPSKGKMRIRFSLPNSAKATLSVFNNLGMLISLLSDEEYPEGISELEWDASGLPKGLYLIRFSSGEVQQYLKVIYL